MTVCQSVSPLDKTHVLSPLIGTHIFAQGHIERRSRPAAPGDDGNMSSPVTPRGAAAQQHKYGEVRWIVGGPWQREGSALKRGVPPSKPESILLPAFLRPSSAARLLLRRHRPPRGRIIHCPKVPKGKRSPSTKATVIAILHSPPPS